MDIFFKTAAGILVSLSVYIILDKHGKDFSVPFSLAVCCMIITAGLAYLEPITDFFSHLESLGNFETGMLKTLMKAVGVCLLGELTTLVCTDAGNAALGKLLQLVTTFAIIWMSIPLFMSLLELLERILGGV